MRFEYLNRIPDGEWSLRGDGRLWMTFSTLQLSHHLGVEPEPGWLDRFDLLGHGQPRCYRHWPGPLRWQTEVSCWPEDRAVAPAERTGEC